MEGGQSPSLGDPSLLNLVDHASGMSEAPHVASIAQDITSADVDFAGESPAPLEKPRYNTTSSLDDGDELGGSNREELLSGKGIGGAP